MNTQPGICLVVASPMTLRAFLVAHIAALREHYAVSVVANFGETSAKSDSSGVELISIPIERPIAPWRDGVALYLLLRLFRRRRYAAIQSVTPKAGLLAMLAGFIARVPVRVHIFTGQVWATRTGAARWFLRTMDRLIAACATHVLVDSPSQRDFLSAEGVVSPGRSRVLASGSIAGVDAQRFKPDAQARSEVRAQLGVREDSIVFLYLGRLTRDKGVLDLAAAFARIASTESRLRLVYVGPDEDRLRGAIENALGAALPRAGFVAETDRPERYLAAADVLCLPSYREGFGTTILEAGACGVPAVGSRIYGITDAIEDGITGLLFKTGDIGELAERMSRLAGNAALLHGMGERARAKALRDFPPGAITAELVQLYAAATGSGQR